MGVGGCRRIFGRGLAEVKGGGGGVWARRTGQGEGKIREEMGE